MIRRLQLFEMDEPILNVGTTFDCWESFADALEQYSQTRHVQFNCVNSRTVAAANKILLGAGKPGKDYAKEIKYAYIKLGCKHYGKPRRAGRGIRNNQRLVT